MRKKGQAAMEFLMTYGWAILVVLGAIAALAYFGVLSPQQFIPEKCTLPPGFGCLDQAGDTSGFQFVMTNGQGNSVEITELMFEDNQGNSGACQNSTGTQISATGGNLSLGSGQQETISCNPSGGYESGDKVMATIEFNYNTGTGLDHTKTGDLVIEVP